VREFNLHPLVDIESLAHVFEQYFYIVLADAEFPNITEPNGKLNSWFITILTKVV
jgi:hypothetical protein